MRGTLSLISRTLAYGDVGITSNPELQYVNWSTSKNYQVENPTGLPYKVEPGETLSLFSTVRATSVAGDTEFTISLSPLSSTDYRFTHTAGTAPVLRTNRGLALSGNNVTIAVNANQTVTMTSALAAGFAAVVVGDTVFIPGVSTGDSASPFDSANEGYWEVIGKDSSTVLQLARPQDVTFLATSETVAVVANSDVQAFSAAGVQVGDAVDISAGFATVVKKKYKVTAVHPSWFEVTSTSPLPLNAKATPGASGIQFYDGAKRFLQVAFDQECTLNINGVTGALRLDPWVAGDQGNMSLHQHAGLVWSLAVVNRSQETMNILVITAE